MDWGGPVAVLGGSGFAVCWRPLGSVLDNHLHDAACGSSRVVVAHAAIARAAGIQSGRHAPGPGTGGGTDAGWDGLQRLAEAHGRSMVLVVVLFTLMVAKGTLLLIRSRTSVGFSRELGRNLVLDQPGRPCLTVLSGPRPVRLESACFCRTTDPSQLGPIPALIVSGCNSWAAPQMAP
jgi:hypothetical protein